MSKTLHDHEYLGKEFYRRESIQEALYDKLVPKKTKKCISAEEEEGGYTFFFLVDEQGNLERISESMLSSRWIQTDDFARLFALMDKEIERLTDTRNMLINFFTKDETGGLEGMSPLK